MCSVMADLSVFNQLSEKIWESYESDFYLLISFSILDIDNESVLSIVVP